MFSPLSEWFPIQTSFKTLSFIEGELQRQSPGKVAKMNGSFKGPKLPFLQKLKKESYEKLKRSHSTDTLKKTPKLPEL